MSRPPLPTDPPRSTFCTFSLPTYPPASVLRTACETRPFAVLGFGLGVAAGVEVVALAVLVSELEDDPSSVLEQPAARATRANSASVNEMRFMLFVSSGSPDSLSGFRRAVARGPERADRVELRGCPAADYR